MTPEGVLTDLQAHGVCFEVLGETLRVDAPPGVLSDKAKEELRRLKPEIISLLQSPQVGDGLGGVEPAEPNSVTVAELCAMRLSEFADAGLVVEVRSEVLGEVVVFASDNARLDPGERRTVYRAAELRALADLASLRSDELRQVHSAKRTFKGTILA